ncbi:MAG: CPBP family intramembrane metalloprotease [Acidobacteriota bacterium]|nr:MAG: CPBP family intramembrane metalloprotease [Acidobacteriota bacterium]
MTAWVLSYIWLWDGAFPGHFALCAALYFTIGYAAHRRRGETPHDIGLRLDNWRPAAREAVLALGPYLVIPLVVGFFADSLRGPTAGWPLAVTARILWGTAQQYGLVCFYYRRLGELLGSSRAAIAAAAMLFALFHLPNPALTLITLSAGAICCWLYRRTPNLIVLGVAHGVISFVLGRSLPDAWLIGMRVGPGCIRYATELFGS